MRRATILLALVGGLLGSVTATTVAIVGTLTAKPGSSWLLVHLPWVGVVLGAAALVGAGVSEKDPEASIILLLTSGFLGFPFVGHHWAATGIMLIIGALLRATSRPLKPVMRSRHSM